MWTYSDMKEYWDDFKRHKIMCSLLAILVIVIVLAVLPWATSYFGEKGKQSATPKMGLPENKLEIGDESVVMGNVSSGRVGNRSVVIGPTDNRGNTIVNQPGAYGYGAHAGPGSIAVGAYAGAGSVVEDNKKNSY